MSAGTTRLRPVLMTAAAMIVGMLPMAIGGPGEEQNAVLARAVIGGVAIGTITTLLFVPYLYSIIGKFDRRRAELPPSLMQFGARSMNQTPPQPPETLPQAPEQLSPIDPNQEQHRRRTTRWLGLGALVALGLLVGVGAWGHTERQAATIATLQAGRDAVPVVRTTILKPLEAPRQIDFPGSTQAFDSAMLYARATGYISKRNVDIGSRVHAGDVLAVIAAPDLDQQLVQARAQLVQMQASLAQSQTNMELAKVTNGRTSRTRWPGLDQPAAGRPGPAGLRGQHRRRRAWRAPMCRRSRRRSAGWRN